MSSTKIWEVALVKSQEDVSYRNDSMKYVNEERRNPKEECEKTVEFLGLLYFSWRVLKNFTPHEKFHGGFGK